MDHQCKTCFKENNSKLFYKMHGTGNAFILVFYNGQTQQVLKSFTKRVCHPKFGIGADGLLIIYQPSESNKSYHMKIYNQDGSYAQMCGNGLRCFCALLYQLNLEKNQFDVSTDSGIKKVKVSDVKPKIEYKVKISMGIPVKGSYENISNKVKDILNTEIEFAYLMVFNVPHVVVKVDQSMKDYEEWGKKIQKEINANINFIYYEKKPKVTEANAITFQRGAGITLSCGTGVSSCFYTLFSQKVCEEKCTLKTNGGNIEMSFENNCVFMNGPASFICKGQTDLK